MDLCARSDCAPALRDHHLHSDSTGTSSHRDEESRFRPEVRLIDTQRKRHNRERIGRKAREGDMSKSGPPQTPQTLRLVASSQFAPRPHTFQASNNNVQSHSVVHTYSTSLRGEDRHTRVRQASEAWVKPNKGLALAQHRVGGWALRRDFRPATVFWARNTSR